MPHSPVFDHMFQLSLPIPRQPPCAPSPLPVSKSVLISCRSGTEAFGWRMGPGQWGKPAPHGFAAANPRGKRYSHSIVPGGLEVMS